MECGDEEHGRFLVTIKEYDGRSLIDEINAATDKIRTLEIALEASDELERKWKRQRRRLRKEVEKYATAYRVATHAGDVAREQLAKSRARNDALAHALIGLTTAVSDMRSGKSIPTRGYLDMLAGRLDQAIAEADRVLGSEPSAA